MGVFNTIKRKLLFYPSIAYGLAGGHFENKNYEKSLCLCKKAIDYGYSSEFERRMCIEFIDLAISCCIKIDERSAWDEVVRLVDGSGIAINDIKNYSILKRHT